MKPTFQCPVCNSQIPNPSEYGRYFVRRLVNDLPVHGFIVPFMGEELMAKYRQEMEASGFRLECAYHQEEYQSELVNVAEEMKARVQFEDGFYPPLIREMAWKRMLVRYL